MNKTKLEDKYKVIEKQESWMKVQVKEMIESQETVM